MTEPLARPLTPLPFLSNQDFGSLPPLVHSLLDVQLQLSDRLSALLLLVQPVARNGVSIGLNCTELECLVSTSFL